MPDLSRDGSKLRQLRLLSLFCIVFGSKSLLISYFGSPIPVQDQWDGETLMIYTPYLENALQFWPMISGHHEHRILLPRILMLGIFEASGQWDTMLEMLVNAALHSATIVTLTSILARSISEQDQPALFTLSAVVFSLPIGWENTLSGFQSCFYLLLLCSIVSLAIFVRARPFSAWWFTAMVAACASYFSMASGAISFLAAGITITLQLFLGCRTGFREWCSLAAIFLASAICLATIPHIPTHDALKANSVIAFLSAFVSLAGFPISLAAASQPFALKAFIMLFAIAPAHWLFTSLRSERINTFSAWFAFAIFALVGLQISSLSYGRADGYFASRYFDLFTILLPTGFVALVLVGVDRYLRNTWLLVSLVSLITYCITTSLPEAEQRRSQGIEQLANVKSFLATSDISVLQGKTLFQIPYSDPIKLWQLLSTPAIRATFPAEFRPDDTATQQYRAEKLTKTGLYKLVSDLKNVILAHSALILAFGVGFLFIQTLPPRQQHRPL